MTAARPSDAALAEAWLDRLPSTGAACGGCVQTAMRLLTPMWSFLQHGPNPKSQPGPRQNAAELLITANRRFTMTARTVTSIRRAEAATPRPLPGRPELRTRVEAQRLQLFRAIRMVTMLAELTDADLDDDARERATDGIHETLTSIIAMLDDIAGQLDPIRLLAPDVRS